jgi:hypothetical protein
MRSFWRQRRAQFRGANGFKEVHFPSPLSMYHKGRYVTFCGRAGDSKNCHFVNYLAELFAR